jgi:hypothetical protein
MKRLSLILTVVFLLGAVALIGCNKTEPANANNSNKAVSTATPAVPAATKSSAPSTAADTGVAACDEYLTKMEKCLNNPRVPEAAKAAYRQSLPQNRAAWKQAASTPQGKAALETSCKAALENAKSFLATCK